MRSICIARSGRASGLLSKPGANIHMTIGAATIPMTVTTNKIRPK